MRRVQQRWILRRSRLPSCSRHLCTELDRSTTTPARVTLGTSLPMMRYVLRGRSRGQRQRKSSRGTQSAPLPRRIFALPFLKTATTLTPSRIHSPCCRSESTRACIAILAQSLLHGVPRGKVKSVKQAGHFAQHCIISATLISKALRLARVNENFTCYPTPLPRSGMSHTCPYFPAAEHHRTLADTHFPSR